MIYFGIQYLEYNLNKAVCNKVYACFYRYLYSSTLGFRFKRTHPSMCSSMLFFELSYLLYKFIFSFFNKKKTLLICFLERMLSVPSIAYTFFIVFVFATKFEIIVFIIVSEFSFHTRLALPAEFNT